MEKNIHSQKEDDCIREMMRTAKMRAPENLKYRIMQQIETEKSLTSSRIDVRKEQGNVLRDYGIIFGTMYAVLAVMIAATYFLFGKEFLLSTQFPGTTLLVVFIFSLLWLITRLDARLQYKRKTGKGQSTKRKGLSA